MHRAAGSLSASTARQHGMRSPGAVEGPTAPLLDEPKPCQRRHAGWTEAGPWSLPYTDTSAIIAHECPQPTNAMDCSSTHSPRPARSPASSHACLLQLIRRAGPQTHASGVRESPKLNWPPVLWQRPPSSSTTQKLGAPAGERRSARLPAGAIPYPPSHSVIASAALAPPPLAAPVLALAAVSPPVVSVTPVPV